MYDVFSKTEKLMYLCNKSQKIIDLSYNPLSFVNIDLKHPVYTKRSLKAIFVREILRFRQFNTSENICVVKSANE